MTRTVQMIEDELSDARGELADAKRRLEDAELEVGEAENIIADLEEELRAGGYAALPKGMSVEQYEPLLKQAPSRFAALDTLRLLAKADKRFTVKLAEVERLRTSELRA